MNKARAHLVLELQTEVLVRRHAQRISLSSINSGATFSIKPAPRGTETLRRLADHPDGDPMVELALNYEVSDAADLVLCVSR